MKISRKAALLVVALTFATNAGFGQAKSPSEKIVAQLKGLSPDEKRSRLKDPVTYAEYLAFHVAKSEIAANAEKQRIDKQVSSSAGAAGTTSAVSRGSVPWLLGFALEHGAVTQSVESNTVAFRGNVLNVIKAMSVKDYLLSYRAGADNPLLRNLSNVSFALSFNTAQNPGSTGSTSSLGTGSFSGYSFHIDLYNHRDPRDGKWAKHWNALLKNSGTNLANTWTDFSQLTASHANQMSQWSSYISSQMNLLSLDSDDDATLASVVYTVASKFAELFGQLPDVRDQATKVAQALETYATAKNGVVDTITKSPIVSVEYANIRQSTSPLPSSLQNSNVTIPSSVPDLSNITIISGMYLAAGSQLTVNAGTTLFNSRPAGSTIGRVRDYRVSGQADIPLREIPSLGKPIVSLSGLFMSLLEQPLGQPVSVNGINVQQTGNIRLFQATFTVKVKDSGVKVPISFTACNRTELIKESEVRGTVGITWDLDSLFAK